MYENKLVGVAIDTREKHFQTAERKIISELIPESFKKVTKSQFRSIEIPKLLNNVKGALIPRTKKHFDTFIRFHFCIRYLELLGLAIF